MCHLRSLHILWGKSRTYCMVSIDSTVQPGLRWSRLASRELHTLTLTPALGDCPRWRQEYLGFDGRQKAWEMEDGSLSPRRTRKGVGAMWAPAGAPGLQSADGPALALKASAAASAGKHVFIVSAVECSVRSRTSRGQGLRVVLAVVTFLETFRSVDNEVGRAG